jgi:hypothetical protein
MKKPKAKSKASTAKPSVSEPEECDQNYDFRCLYQASRETLICACLYEYARESEHVCRTAARWMKLKEVRSKIVESEVRDEKPPKHLVDQLAELYDAEYDLEEIETGGGEMGVPHITTLSQYLVNDVPWLLVPEKDREHAIESAFQHRGIDYGSPAFHRVVPCITFAKREDGSLGEVPDVSIPREMRILINWHYSDSELLKAFRKWLPDNRPPKHKDQAKNSGRGRDPSYYAALKYLAAMRLVHHYRPSAAFARFIEFFPTGNRMFDNGELRKLRRKARKMFNRFFPFDEKPLRWLTFTALNRG